MSRVEEPEDRFHLKNYDDAVKMAGAIGIDMPPSYELLRYGPLGAVAKRFLGILDSNPDTAESVQDYAIRKGIDLSG